jgi:ABC-2 type transport system ATP-binding protein
MIKVTNLVKDFGAVKALRGISFEVRHGDVLGLLGPNGAGKTTAMRIVTGFLNPTAGEVTVDGLPVQENLWESQRRIGYLPETAPLYPDLSVQEHLDFAAEIRGITGTAKKRAVTNITEVCGLKDKFYANVSELSKGYRQRLGLGQALIHDPPILILDEPTTGLDPNQIIEIRKLITMLGEKKTVILSTHIMQEVEAVCNRVVLINKGNVVADASPDELRHKQSTGIEIKLSVRGNQKEIIGLLENIPGVKNVKKLTHPERGANMFMITSNNDIRSEINKTMIKNDCDVLEIAAHENSMEDVFRELTK